MWQVLGKCLFVCLGVHWSLSLVVPAESRIQVKDITYLGPQISPQLTGLSRDGGVSVLLNGRVVWLFDDTQLTSSTDDLFVFVSNTVAYSHAPQANLTFLQNFGISEAASRDGTPSERTLSIDKTLSSGGWIPFSKAELSFNRQNPGKDRVAIWPGTNPAPLNTASAILYAPLVHVKVADDTNSTQYKAQGVTLITIKAGHTGPTASRNPEVLFSSDDVPFGVFVAIVGHKNGDLHLDVYLFGIVNTGLQLARVKSTFMDDLHAYEYLDPTTCSFTSSPPNPGNDNLSDVYLAGNFSSGSIFYSPFFKTFVLVYFNNEADSTFYTRYLDLDSAVCPTETWIKGGKYGNGVKAEDVEAVYRYAWSSEHVLYRSPPGPKGFNYAGFAHPEFFNNQYYAKKYAYWYQGISSQMESGWFGGGLVGQEQAGGDGRHLLLSWTSQEEGLNGGGRYQVMLAKVEFDNIAQSSMATPTTPIQTSSPLTPSASQVTSSTVNAGGSLCHSRIWSVSWQLAWSMLIVQQALVSLVFGFPF